VSLISGREKRLDAMSRKYCVSLSHRYGFNPAITGTSLANSIMLIGRPTERERASSPDPAALAAFSLTSARRSAAALKEAFQSGLIFSIASMISFAPGGGGADDVELVARWLGGSRRAAKRPTSSAFRPEVGKPSSLSRVFSCLTVSFLHSLRPPPPSLDEEDAAEGATVSEGQRDRIADTRAGRKAEPRGLHWSRALETALARRRSGRIVMQRNVIAGLVLAKRRARPGPGRTGMGNGNERVLLGPRRN